MLDPNDDARAKVPTRATMPINRRGKRSNGHTLFVVGAGLLGWLTLGLASLQGAPLDGEPLALGAFFGFCLAARMLSFEALRGMAISLDSAFYMAGVWLLGSLNTAWVAAAVLLLDGARRAALRSPGKDPPQPGARPHSAGWLTLAIIASAGIVAAQLLVVGWVVPLELFQTNALGADVASHAWVLVGVPLLTLAFVALNYGVGGFALWLQGHDARAVASRLVRFGVAAELLQVPLAILAIELFVPERLFNFVLLGVTFIVINAGFKMITLRDAALELRVRELTTLNELSRAIAGTLDQDQLVARIAEAARNLVPASTLVAVGVRDETGQNLAVRLFEDAVAPAREATLRVGQGLAARVVAYRSPRYLVDLTADRPAGERALAPWEQAARSWLGVPLAVFDDTIGYLAVQSASPSAFSEDDRRALESIAGQAAAAIDNARLYGLATTDGLTRLFVRRYFDQRLLEEWRRAERYGHGFAVALLDLDDFKALNDRHGHHAGDRALREVATVLRRCIREVDIAARYGGEELAVLLPRATSAEAIAVAERIRAELEALRLDIDGEVVRLTASFGVASHPEGNVDGPQALVRAADGALYEAKAAGKNRVAAHSAPKNQLAL